MASNPSTTLTNKDQVLAQLTNHRGDHLLVVGGRDDPHCVCENLKEDTIFTHLIFQLQKITAPTYFHILHLYLTTDSLITEPVCMKKLTQVIKMSLFCSRKFVGESLFSG